jgi:hypothetical protein
MPRVLRFFLGVAVVPRSMLGALGAVTALGCLAIAADVLLAVRALAPVLLLQLFSAASGFGLPARRGYYDLLLTSGEGRATIAVGHWVVSVLPGILAWLALAVTEHGAGGRTLATSGTIVAVVLTSTIPWSLTMSLPRLSGAIVWLVVASIAMSRSPIRGETHVGLLFPWSLVATDLRGRDAYVGLALGILSVSTVGAAIWMIRRTDVPLESGQ